MNDDTIHKAYMQVISEASDEESDVADLLWSRVDCTHEEADAFVMDLIVSGVSEEDLRKEILLINEPTDGTRNSGYSLRTIKTVCEGWRDTWSENDSLSLDDVKSFEELRWLSHKDWREAWTYHARTLVDEATNDERAAKIAKALMHNISINIVELFMKYLYKEAITMRRYA